MAVRSGSVFFVGIALLASCVSGSAATVITVDESGNGTVNGTALPSHLGADPRSGEVHTNVLTYGPLPFAGVLGDVKIAVGGAPVDVIRFNGDSTILFYAGPNVAQNDSSLATQFSPPIQPFPGPNTIMPALTGSIMSYTPTSGQPGFDSSGPTYIFILSPSTPPTNILNPVGSNLRSAFQTNYVANLNLGDGVVNLSNVGTAAASVAPVTGTNSSGNICVNAYVYQANEQLLACCSCPTTPDDLHAWPVIFGPGNLLTNAATKPNSVIIKLVATSPGPGSTPTNIICDPAFQSAPFTLVPGLRASITHSHPTTTTTVAITETLFQQKALSTGEAQKLQTDCTGLGSGRRCPTCLTGGLAVPAP